MDIQNMCSIIGEQNMSMQAPTQERERPLKKEVSVERLAELLGVDVKILINPIVESRADGSSNDAKCEDSR